MGAKEDQVLRAAKEVTVKFIEMGRISPANFSESFQMIYEAIDGQVRKAGTRAEGVKEES